MMHAPSITADEREGELVRLVADIRARGAGQALPVPPSEAIAALLTRLRAEKPMGSDELVEHERQWRAMDEELRALERTDAQRDKLL
jgi:hypothetical protein